MDVITIKEITDEPSDYSDGEVVFTLINEKLLSDKPVAVSFSGLSAVTSAFINSALIRLLEYHTYNKIKKLLKIINSTKQINDTILDRFEFVTRSGHNVKIESKSPK